MSIAKSDEIKNLLVSNSELMVAVAYPHTYCRVVPLQTACGIDLQLNVSRPQK